MKRPTLAVCSVLAFAVLLFPEASRAQSGTPQARGQKPEKIPYEVASDWVQTLGGGGAVMDAYEIHESNPYGYLMVRDSTSGYMHRFRLKVADLPEGPLRQRVDGPDSFFERMGWHPATLHYELDRFARDHKLDASDTRAVLDKAIADYEGKTGMPTGLPQQDRPIAKFFKGLLLTEPYNRNELVEFLYKEDNSSETHLTRVTDAIQTGKEVQRLLAGLTETARTGEWVPGSELYRKLHQQISDELANRAEAEKASGRNPDDDVFGVRELRALLNQMQAGVDAAGAAVDKHDAIPAPAPPVAATPVPTADDDLAQATADADAIAAEAKKKRDKKKADADAAAKLAAAKKGPVKTEPPPPPDGRDPIPPKAPTRAPQGKLWETLKQQGQEDARGKAEADAAQRRADAERERIAREQEAERERIAREQEAEQERIAREQDEWRRRAEARDQADQDARHRAEADARARDQAAAEAAAWARETAKLADEVAKQKELEARSGADSGRRGPSMNPSAADMLIRERFKAKFGRDMNEAEHQQLIDALGWKQGDEVTQALLDKAFGLIAAYSGSLPSSGSGGTPPAPPSASTKPAGGGTPAATPSASTKAAAIAKCEADYQSEAVRIRANTQWNISGLASWGNGCYAADTAFTACYEQGCKLLRGSGIYNACTKQCTDSFILACKNENLADFAVQRDQCVARAK